MQPEKGKANTKTTKGTGTGKEGERGRAQQKRVWGNSKPCPYQATRALRHSGVTKGCFALERTSLLFLLFTLACFTSLTPTHILSSFILTHPFSKAIMLQTTSHGEPATLDQLLKEKRENRKESGPWMSMNSSGTAFSRLFFLLRVALLRCLEPLSFLFLLYSPTSRPLPSSPNPLPTTSKSQRTSQVNPSTSHLFLSHGDKGKTCLHCRTPTSTVKGLLLAT